MMRIPITFGLVVHDEERLIVRALESIASVAAEVIVVHDGACSDATLLIAERYGARVEVRGREGGSDPHRPFILQEARYDWVFMLDADEFLSPELQDFLRDFSPKKECAAYAFKWPFWDGGRYVTSVNYRPCLFYRPRAWAIGLHNFSTQSVGEICRQDIVLEHIPLHPKLGLRLFGTTLKARIERDARQYLKGYDALPKFNEHLIPPSFIAAFASFLSHPIRHAWYNFVFYFLGSYKSLWRDGAAGFLVSFQLGLYQYKLGRAIARLKAAQV